MYSLKLNVKLKRSIWFIKNKTNKKFA